MHRAVFSAFVDELEKRAVSVKLLQDVIAKRTAQGVGGAAALGKQVTGAVGRGATTSRQIMQQAGGLGQAQLRSMTQGGRAASQAERAWTGAKSGLVNRFESTPVKYDMSKPLKTHEGYMGGTHHYAPEYARSVAASPAKVEMTPRALAQAAPQPPVAAGTAVNPIKARRAVSSSGIQPSAGATVPGRPGAARGGDTVLAPVTGFERTTLIPATRVAV